MGRRLTLFGHPLHPPTVHFPLALILLAPLLDGAALWRGEPWWTFSFWTLAAGAAAAVPAAATGVLDLLALDRRLPAFNAAIVHMGLMAAGLALDLGSLLARARPGPLAGTRMAAAVGLSVAAALVVGVGGWFGGHLVYHHRVGIDG